MKEPTKQVLLTATVQLTLQRLEVIKSKPGKDIN